jgi:hypothetical protein
MRISAFLFQILIIIAACGHQNSHTNNLDPNTPVVYACPMDCENGKTYPEKGTCPVCKMDLKPVAAPTSSTEPGSYQMLEKETMTIHDDAMKVMAEMNQVGLELKNQMISSQMTLEANKQYTDVLAAMEKAEKDMMTLMPQLHTPEGMPVADALKFWENLKAKMTQNYMDMQAALEAGQKLKGK